MSKDYNSKDILHIKENDIQYLRFKILEKYKDKLTHAITLRYGGVSTIPYDSLNFRKDNVIEEKNVNQNVKILCDALNVPLNTLCKATQKHTSNILILSKNNMNRYLFEKQNNEPFDAYILKDRGISTYVTTADCVPIIVYDPENNIVCNIHSGWRGTVAKIYMKVIDILEKEYNCNLKDLIFCIGPHIRKCCFSSEEEEFKSNFTNVWKNEKEYIYYKGNRFYIDMEYLIKTDLLQKGLKLENIVSCGICTCCNSNDFFSCRVAKKNNVDFGTFATFTSLS